MTITNSFGWTQVMRWRMEQHSLAGTSATSLTKVSQKLAGIQAQVMSSAEVALCLRTGRKPQDVQNALWKKRALLKTWTVRGTLHLIVPDDLALFVTVMKLRGEYWA